MNRRIAAGVAWLALFAATNADAQTVLGGTPPVSTTPPGRSGAAPAPAAHGQPGQTQPGQAAAAPAPAQPTRQIPASVVEQMQAQAEGTFTPWDRTGVGGQIQEAWSFAPPRDGVYTTRMCEDCVYKVRVREFMATTIILPEGAAIASADLGDPSTFKVQIKSTNMLAIRPATYGVDTNLNVYTKSGAVYPFYVRSEAFNSVNVPDVVVRLVGKEPGPKSDESGVIVANLDPPPAPDGKSGAPGAYPGAKPTDKKAAAVTGLVTPTADAGDFVRSVPFDPAKLHGWNDYKLYGDRELRPKMVYRDQFFTYIQYAEKWDGMELATAYVVNDEIDELVNTRVQGSTFIVESVAPLISLKNGKKYLCIKYTGETL